MKECWFVSVAFSGDVAAPPRKRGWGRIFFFRPYRYARAGTHAWLELAASPGRESFTSVSGGVDSLQIRGGTRCAREGEEGGGRAAAAPKAAPPCVAARLDAMRRRPRVGPPTSPRVRWECGASPPEVWWRCGTSQWVSWVAVGRRRGTALAQWGQQCSCDAKECAPGPPGIRTESGGVRDEGR